MNKRFFTLMAAVLLAGAPLANVAFAETPVQVELTADQLTKVKLANGLRFALKKGTNYVKVEKIGSTGLVQISAVGTDNIKDAAVFEITGLANSTFQLKTADGQVVDNGNDKRKLFYAAKDGTLSETADFNSIQILKVGTTDDELVPAVPAFMAIEYYANDLNSNLSGAGFKLNFPGLAVQPEENPFGEQMVAIPATAVKTICAVGNVDDADLFFVKADEAGLKLLANVNAYIAKYEAERDLDEKAKLKIDEATFKAATFIVVNPNKNFGISALTGKGEGYDFTQVKGEKLAADNDKANGKIAFVNGIFGIAEEDHYNAEDELDILVSPKVVVGNDQNVLADDVYVGVYSLTTGGLKSYVTTKQDNSQLSKATTGGNTYAAAADVLKTSKEAAIYNIYFQGSKEDAGTDKSSYGKYYVYGEDADAPKYVNTKLSYAQWVVTSVGAKGAVTFANVYDNTETVTLKLYKTSTAGVYQVASGFPERLPAKGTDHIKLIPATEEGSFLTATDSQLKRKATIVFKGSGNVTVGSIYPTIDKKKQPDNTYKYSVAVTSKADDCATWYLEKAEKIEKALKFKYLSGNTIKEDVVKSSIQTYALISSKEMKGVKAFDEEELITVNDDLAGLARCAFWRTPDGTYALVNVDKENYEPQGSTTDPVLTYEDIVNGGIVYVDTDADGSIEVSDYVNEPSAYCTVTISFEALGESLPAVSRHATFEGIEGGISMLADAKGILNAVVSAQPLTFWLDTAESKAETPKFYISKGIAAEEEETETKAAEAETRLFLYTPSDSTSYWDADKAEFVPNENYYNAVKDLKAIFRPAALVAVDTIATVQGNKEVLVSKEAKTGVVAGLDRFQFAITKSGEDYVITNHAGDYLYNLNGVLGFTTAKNQAIHVSIGEGDPTANEAIEAEANVQVIGGQGVVTVQGAAGKVITVANILGQTIANQVAASDNVTIAAPAGIVVVSVDGDATKVIVK